MASPSEIRVTLPGRRRVDAQVGRHVVHTDQPVDGGGEDAAPSPYQLFLASLATCAGIFVQGFCAKRELPTEGIGLVLRTENDPEGGALARVSIDIEVPPSFPEKYREALVRVVDGCSVKRAIQAQPAFETRTVVR
jgi:ribosomal protein S12 methylthiotransferase accessory factor